VLLDELRKPFNRPLYKTHSGRGKPNALRTTKNISRKLAADCFSIYFRAAAGNDELGPGREKIEQNKTGKLNGLMSRLITNAESFEKCNTRLAG
jgi:hypothetical protein